MAKRYFFVKSFVMTNIIVVFKMKIIWLHFYYTHKHKKNLLNTISRNVGIQPIDHLNINSYGLLFVLNYLFVQSKM